MIIALTGATGFIGTFLCSDLESAGATVRPIPRTAGPTRTALLEGTSAVIHLAGEPIDQRWTSEAKHRIRSSRVDGTQALIEDLSLTTPRPSVFVCASAVGYYGSRGDETLTEASQPGTGFLPESCAAWEKSADLASSLGLRVVKLRTGMVVGPKGGALQKMLPPFRLGLGGPIAGGRQWMSWIHIADVAGLYRFALESPSLSGPLNAVSPQPVRNRDFTTALARAIHRPAIIPVPAFALRLLYGEMSEVVLGSQRVVPQAAQQAGFQFRYPDLNDALRDVLS